MTKKMHIKIRKSPKTVIEFMILYFCIMGILLLFGAPHAIGYVLDLCCVVLLLCLMTGNKLKKIIQNKLVLLQLLMILAGIIIAIVNGVSPLLVAWSLRNFLRFLIFFGCCIHYLTSHDYERIINKLNILFYINVAMVAFEFSVLHLTADEIGGIFGATQTTNGDLNVFLIIMTTYYVIKWEKKEKTFAGLVIILAINMFISILAELKIFFFEVVVIFALVFIISRIISPGKKISFKWIALIIAGIVILRIAIDYLGRVYTNWAGFFTYEKIIRELTRTGGYSNRGDINRFTFMKIIDKQIFQGDAFSKIFGIGLGGAEFSGASDLLTSSIYNRFESLHYHYFSTSWMYVECGIVGLVLYIMSLLSPAFKGIHYIRKKKEKDNRWLIFGITISFISIILIIYNQSMRLPSAYLIYWIMAAVFINRKEPKCSSVYEDIPIHR